MLCMMTVKKLTTDQRLTKLERAVEDSLKWQAVTNQSLDTTTRILEGMQRRIEDLEFGPHRSTH